MVHGPSIKMIAQVAMNRTSSARAMAVRPTRREAGRSNAYRCSSTAVRKVIANSVGKRKTNPNARSEPPKVWQSGPLMMIFTATSVANNAAAPRDAVGRHALYT